GFGLAPAQDEFAKARQLAGCKGALSVDDQTQAIGIECLREQHLGVETRAVFEAAAREIVRGPGEHAPDRPYDGLALAFRYARAHSECAPLLAVPVTGAGCWPPQRGGSGQVRASARAYQRPGR